MEISRNLQNTVVAKSESATIASQTSDAVKLVKKHICDELQASRMTTDLATREINKLEQICAKPQDHNLLKRSLKELKKRLEEYKAAKHPDLRDEQASFEKLNPLVADMHKNIDAYINSISYDRIESSQGEVVLEKLTANYNMVMEIINNNDDLTAGDLLIRLNNILEKITEIKNEIGIILQKEFINKQLDILVDGDKSAKGMQEKARYIQKIITSPENFEAFESDQFLYSKVKKMYLSNLGVDEKNYDYDLAFVNMRDANEEYKKIKGQQLAQNLDVEKIKILKENILELATQLENR